MSAQPPCKDQRNGHRGHDADRVILLSECEPDENREKERSACRACEVGGESCGCGDYDGLRLHPAVAVVARSLFRPPPRDQRKHREKPEQVVRKNFLSQPDDLRRDRDEEPGAECRSGGCNAPQPDAAREHRPRGDEDHQNLQSHDRTETREKAERHYRRKDRRVLRMRGKERIPDVSVVVALDERLREGDVRCVITARERGLAE